MSAPNRNLPEAHHTAHNDGLKRLEEISLLSLDSTTGRNAAQELAQLALLSDASPAGDRARIM